MCRFWLRNAKGNLSSFNWIEHRIHATKAAYLNPTVLSQLTPPIWCLYWWRTWTQRMIVDRLWCFANPNFRFATTLEYPVFLMPQDVMRSRRRWIRSIISCTPLASIALCRPWRLLHKEINPLVLHWRFQPLLYFHSLQRLAGCWTFSCDSFFVFFLAGTVGNSWGYHISERHLIGFCVLLQFSKLMGHS